MPKEIARKARDKDKREEAARPQAPKAAEDKARLAVETIAIDKLQHHPKNPRVHDERNIQSVIRSMSDFGQMLPLVVWGRQNYVIVGNGRLSALQRMGRATAKIVRADHLTEAQALAYMIADNRTGDLSDFDYDMLLSMFDENPEIIESSAFSSVEIAPLMSNAFAAEEQSAADKSGSHARSGSTAGDDDDVIVHIADVRSVLVAVKEKYAFDSFAECILECVRQWGDQHARKL